jgi:hypothetical protein
MRRDRLELGIQILLLVTAVWISITGIAALVSRQAPVLHTAAAPATSHTG